LRIRQIIRLVLAGRYRYISLWLIALLVTSSVRGQRPSPQSLYDKAVKAYESGDVPKAIKLYQELLHEAPRSVEARANLGAALAHEGRYRDAIEQYHEGLRWSPGNQVLRRNLALAWYKLADFKKASTELVLLHSQISSDQQVVELLADCYLRLGMHREAIVLLEPSYRDHPDDPAIDYELGTALIQGGRIKEGEAVIDHIFRNGDPATAGVLMGAAQYSAGDYRTAAATIRKALDSNSALPGGWTLYGKALLKTGDNDGAKLAFQRALQADANDFEANIHLGGLLRHDGDYNSAAPYLNRALKLRPDSPSAQFQVGASELATGHLEDARKELEPIARKWPDFIEVHLQLAILYSRLNRPADSNRERQIVLALNSKSRKKGPQPEIEP